MLNEEPSYALNPGRWVLLFLSVGQAIEDQKDLAGHED